MKTKNYAKKNIFCAILCALFACTLLCFAAFNLAVADDASSRVVYLMPSTGGDIVGSDENDGASAQTPVRTLTKAVELAENGGTVVVMGTINVTTAELGVNELTLENLTFERWESFVEDLFYVRGEENNLMTLTLKNVTIDGKNVALSNQSESDALIHSYSYSKLIIDEGAKLINNNAPAICVRDASSSIEMKGGEISGNCTAEGSPYSAGVNVEKGVFEMSGGIIKSNRTEYYFGGGVIVNNGAKFILTGGEISGNYSHSGGGGVAINQSEFIMSGGKILNNIADTDHDDEKQYGGGVYAYDVLPGDAIYLKVTISGGKISGNSADFGNAVSVMSACPNVSVYMSGAPEISGAVDIGPASTAKAVNITSSFTPANPIVMNLWGAAYGTCIASYADGLTPDPFAFTAYNAAFAPKVEGQNVVLVNAVSVTASPAVEENLVYNEQAQALVRAGTAENGVFMYSLKENGAYTAEIPTGTEAQEYTVWYYVKANDTYADTQKSFVTVSIAQKEVTGSITFTAITENGKTLADAEISGTFSVDGAVVWEEPETTAVTYQTEYTWAFTPANSNYKSLTGSTVVYSSCLTHSGEVICGQKPVCEACKEEYGEKVSHSDLDENGVCDICSETLTKGLSGGVIAAIIIGAVVVAVSVCAVIYFKVIKKKN